MSQLDQQLAAASTRYGGCLEPAAGRPITGRRPGRPRRQPARDSDHDIDNIPGGRQMCGKAQGGQTFSASVDGGKVHYPTVANGRCDLTTLT